MLIHEFSHRIRVVALCVYFVLLVARRGTLLVLKSVFMAKIVGIGGA